MNQTNINPTDPFYITGGNVPADALSYVTRDADALLLQHLLQGEFCYILTSRQMGKSSLMTRSVKRLREHSVAPAVLDLSSQGFNLDAGQWYNGLLEQLGRRLKLDEEIEEFCREHPHLSPLQRWQKVLREVVLVSIAGPVVIFIDEIDGVRSLPFSTDEFFAAIRSCYNARTEDPTFARLSFCLLGVATPTDLIANPKLTPFNIGTRIELSNFSREEARSLEMGLGQDGATNAVLMDRIYYWTGGHPYLTQRLCQAVAADDSMLTAEGVDGCAERLFLSAKAQRQDSNLSFVQQRMLPLEEEQRVGLLTLYAKVLSGKAVVDSDTMAYVSELKLSGIVQAVAGQLKVRNRIYAAVFGRAWIAENMPDAELRRQKEAYRRGIWRALAGSGVVLAVVLSLAVFAFQQRNEARENAFQAYKSALHEKQARTEADRNAAERAQALTEADRQCKVAVAAKRQADAKADEARMNFLAEEKQRKTVVTANRKLQQAIHARDLALAAAKSQTFRADAIARAQKAETDHANRLLYIANMNLIPSAWEQNDIARVAELLDDRSGIPYRNFEWGYWHRLCHLDLTTLKGHTNVVTSVAFSPDGKRIVTGSDDHTAKVWDAATGKEILTLKGHTDHVRSVAFSPEGKRFVTGSSDETARIWETWFN